MPSTHLVRNSLRGVVEQVLRLHHRQALERLVGIELQLPAVRGERRRRSRCPSPGTRRGSTSSGITGLTLPGMIDEPGCSAGRLISARPARGPEASRIRSLAIFESLIATLLSADE